MSPAPPPPSLSNRRPMRCARQRKLRVGHQPGIASGHLEWRDRDCHFIFGDIATAVVVEAGHRLLARPQAHLGTRLVTPSSNNIRNNAGFLNRCEPDPARATNLHAGRPQGVQGSRADGRGAHRAAPARTGLADAGAPLLAAPGQPRHEPVDPQAPVGRDVGDDLAPVILTNMPIPRRPAHHRVPRAPCRPEPGDLGLICSFGAGYSIGSVVVRRV